jgi:hypothetical protein
VGFRHVDRRKTELDSSLLVAPGNFCGQNTVVEFSFDFVRLQVFVCVLARDLLPLARALAQFYFQFVVSVG